MYYKLVLSVLLFFSTINLQNQRGRMLTLMYHSLTLMLHLGKFQRVNSSEELPWGKF